MRKLMILFALMVAMTATAQEQVVDMNRTFSVGGKALLLLRSAKAEKKDLKALTWILENNHIGDTNILTLKVKNEKTGENECHQTWNDVNITMTKGDDGLLKYTVTDDMFVHLRVIEFQKDMYMILFYSELLEK